MLITCIVDIRKYIQYKILPNNNCILTKGCTHVKVQSWIMDKPSKYTFDCSICYTTKKYTFRCNEQQTIVVVYWKALASVWITKCLACGSNLCSYTFSHQINVWHLFYSTYHPALLAMHVIWSSSTYDWQLKPGDMTNQSHLHYALPTLLTSQCINTTLPCPFLSWPTSASEESMLIGYITWSLTFQHLERKRKGVQN